MSVRSCAFPLSSLAVAPPPPDLPGTAADPLERVEAFKQKQKVTAQLPKSVGVDISA